MYRPACLAHSASGSLPAKCADSNPRPQPRRAAVVWFRRDLRTVDHEGLSAASGPQYSHVLPVYCLDPLELHPCPLGTQPGLGVPQLGPHRIRFLCQALTSLHKQLQQQYGSGLACLWGHPPQQLPVLVRQLAQEVQQVDLYFQQDHVALPAAVQAEEEAAAAVIAAGQAAGCTVHVRRTWGGTLYHPAHLPWVQAAMHAMPLEQQEPRAEQGPSLTSAHAGSSSPAEAATTTAQATSSSSHQAPQAHVEASAADLLLSQLPGLLQGLPGTMTEFRRAIHGQPQEKQGRKQQERASQDVPAPHNVAGVGTAGGAAGGSSSTSQGAASNPVVVPRIPLSAPQQLSPLPACFTEQCAEPPLVQLHKQAAAAGSWPDQAPAGDATLPGADITWLYQAAGPEATAALLRLQQLTGQAPLAAQQAVPLSSLEASRSSAEAQLEGSEAAAWQRLQWLLQVPSCAASTGTLRGGPQGGKPPFLAGYKESRMLAYGEDTSALLSPYLALGLLTPACIHHAVQRLLLELQGRPPAPATEQVVAGFAITAQQQQQQQQQQQACVDGAEQLLMHLDIRDFFTWSALKAGSSLVRAGGPAQRSGLDWRSDATDLQRWCSGRTGFPFVDASMRQLAATGWSSNRGRQNVASFLAKALQVDWRLGAELFQCLLLDHDGAINLSSWAYVAGVGADPRDRVFKTVTQGERYDPQAQLAGAWLPELSHLPPELRHRPWMQDSTTSSSDTYPLPMLEPASQVAEGPRR